MYFIASCLQVIFLVPKDSFYLRSGLIYGYNTVSQAGICLRGPETSSKNIRSSC